MTKKRGFPMQGELVICTVKKLNPNSADVVLTEYQKEAMIHISEIVSGWVRNIKDHLKPAQTVVAKVMRVNEQDGYIALSVKRVDVRQEKEKLKEYNLDKSVRRSRIHVTGKFWFVIQGVQKIDNKPRFINIQRDIRRMGFHYQRNS
jgi:translation initiation factor 2 alpha subunit (eIF-2alpha)